MAKWMLWLPSLTLAVQIREEVAPHGQDYASLKSMMLEFAAKTKETGKIDQVTIDAVTKFLTDINSTLLTALDSDKAHSQRILDDAVAAVNLCNTERIQWFGMGGRFGGWNEDVTSKQNDHTTCRAQELVTFNNMSSYCQIFENRVCTWDVCELPHGGFDSGDSDAVFTYMSCLDSLFNAQRGGYETDKENCEVATALHASQTELCDAKQNLFEVGYCQRETHVQTECKEYDTCRFNAESSWLNIRSETYEIEDIFQAQFVALHHLLCYGQKILQNSTDLASCDAVGDNCTADYTTCPRIVYNDPQDFIVCSEPTAEIYPCTATFLAFYDDYAGADCVTPVDDCTVCEDTDVQDNTWGGNRKSFPDPSFHGTSEVKPYCVKVTTGTGSSFDGSITVEIDSGSGMVEQASGLHDIGSIVLEKCFSEVQLVQVHNPTNNAWAGSIEFSSNSGATYAPMVCDNTCTSPGSAQEIVVDGNTDGFDMAATTCLSGNTCVLRNPGFELPPENNCIRVITGNGKSFDGNLVVELDTGSGSEVQASGLHGLGSTVLEKCFVDILTVSVRNDANNAWAGTIEHSFDGGIIYSLMSCNDCTGGAGGLAGPIVVDGNLDGESMASTQCLGGVTCTLS